MKFFGWMPSKLNARLGGNNTGSISAPHVVGVKEEPPEESSDWPSGLLAIGTLGNTNLGEKNQDSCQTDAPENPSSSDDLPDFTPEEVGKLQKELTKLLSRKPGTSKSHNEIVHLPLDRFLNCPSSLEVERRISCSQSHSGEPGTGDSDDIEKTISVIIGKCREISADRKKKPAIGKKSISFLLEKMFMCRSGFAPAPSLRDSLQESRMEKLLRILLQKKMYPQGSSRASSIKRYLDDKPKLKAGKEDDDSDDIDYDYGRERTEDKGKWVKTDSEYIVLEI
ncbi:hypothetical protein CRG98_037962 [Punica granatum]|uniref:Uncharacterized protein n=1 Tax=Punica granatum TaxID=22663 RepID=A0A2I0ICG2_PUNGR|nr:hypothetical protein CRG98_037962 [Punica granatum]